MTIKEAIKLGGTSPFLAGNDIAAAETFLLQGELVRHAVAVNCVVNKDWTPGVVILTSHRIFFCHSNTVMAKAVQMPLVDSISVGKISGGMVKKMTITSDAITLTVESSRNVLISLQNAILTAMEAVPNQPQVDLPADAALEKFTLES